jgi:hypothetical protein
MVYSLGSTSTGSVSSGDRSVTSSVTSTQKNVNFGSTAGKEVVIFSIKLYRDLIESYLSELGYLELV